MSNWHSDPPGAVTFAIDPDNANGVMITIVEPAENITIAAVQGSVAGTAPLHVTIGTPSQWALGEVAFTTGADWTLDILQPMAPPEGTKCTTCHSANSSTGFDIQITPSQIARLTDAQIKRILTHGTKPADVDFRVLPSTITLGLTMYTNAALYQRMHVRTLTNDSLDGLVSYVRSLTPRGQGCVTDPNNNICKDVDSDPNGECN